VRVSGERAPAFGIWHLAFDEAPSSTAPARMPGRS
jgi:hypothetical protein